MKLGQLRLGRHLVPGGLAVAFKQSSQSILCRFLPGMYLARMHTVLARELGHRGLLADRRQRHLGLERSAVFLSDIRHLYPLGL